MGKPKIILLGDVVRDVLIPDEGRFQLLVDKESDVEESVARSNAVRSMGGAAYAHRILTNLIKGEVSVAGEQITSIKKYYPDWMATGAYSPNGVIFATGGHSGELYIREAATENEVFALIGHTKAVTDVAWRSDSKALASSSEDGQVILWEMAGGKQIKEWTAHEGGTLVVTFAPNGNIATVGQDRKLKIWEEEGNDDPIRTISASNIFLSVAFSRDSKWVFSRDKTGTIQVWNAENGEEISQTPASIEEQITHSRERITEIITWSPRVKPVSDILMSIADPSEYENKDPAFSTYWMLGKFPESLGDKKPGVYRVHERSVSLANSRERAKKSKKALKKRIKKVIEKKGKNPITVIQDYDCELRYALTRENLTDLSKSTAHISRIISVTSRLPSFIFDRTPKIKGETFWDAFATPVDEKAEPEPDSKIEYQFTGYEKGTVIITSLDRLRQDGAFVSKRKSWDRMIDDFVEELGQFGPLRKLAEFGHFIVRIGVSAVVHVRKDAEDKLNVRFFYDPNAQGGIYRNLHTQGNIFAIRSTLAAVLAFNLRDLKSGERGKAEKVDVVIARSIRESILINQWLYEKGFGKSLNEVREYEKQWEYDNPSGLFSPKKLREIKCRRHKVINESKPPLSPYVLPWALLTGNMRCEINLIDSEKRGEFRKNLEWLEALRRFRCARFIVSGGLDLTVNQREIPSALVGDNSSEECLLESQLEYERHAFAESPDLNANWLRSGLEEIDNMVVDDVLSPGERLQQVLKEGDDKSFDDYLNSQEEEKRSAENWKKKFEDITGVSNYLPSNLFTPMRKEEDWKDIEDRLDKLEKKVLTESFPFSFPVAKFGKLNVASQRGIESYTNIKILMQGYVENRANAKRPLSLAVFGPPGSGKSFGIKQIAEEMSGTFELVECNVSQMTGKEDLNRVFLKVANNLSLNKIPLVFFDEFDCDDLKWLKYFLQPMQDGIYDHPESQINVKPAIFVFAGGTRETFEAFAEKAESKDGELKKAPDFVSRLRGHINISKINVSREQGFSPLKKQEMYISRALLLRGIARAKGFVKGDPDAEKDIGRIMIDEDVVRAMLAVSRYQHGVRSIEALLDMCQPFNGQIIKASLPTISQLNMHTNGIEFLVRVQFPHLHWFHEKIGVFGNWEKPEYQHVFKPTEPTSEAEWVKLDGWNEFAIKQLVEAVRNRRKYCQFKDKEHFFYEFVKETRKGFRFVLMIDRFHYIHLAVESASGHQEAILNVWCLEWTNTEWTVPDEELRERAIKILEDIGKDGTIC